MTKLEALAAIADALDCLAGWDQLLETLDAHADRLDIDPDPIGRYVVLLDAAARTLIRQLEKEVVR